MLFYLFISFINSLLHYSAYPLDAVHGSWRLVVSKCWRMSSNCSSTRQAAVQLVTWIFKTFGSRSNCRKDCMECRATVQDTVPSSCGTSSRCLLPYNGSMRCLFSQFIRFIVIVAIRKCLRWMHNSSFFSSLWRPH